MQRLSFIIALFTVLTCLGCGQGSPKLQEFSGEKFIMDTLIHITVICEDQQRGEKALEKAFAEFERVNSLINRFPTGGQMNSSPGDVIKLNQNAGIKPVTVSVDTINIIKSSQHFSELTGGAFDITLGPVMDLWGFGSKPHVPNAEELNKVLKLVDHRKVKVDPIKATVFLEEPGMSIDLGGVAKGYATDQAVRVLKEMNIKHAIINAGGNVYALGTKADGSAWRVGVQDPRSNKGIIAVLSVKDAAVVSSGDYQRYFDQGGVRYHHIIDPSTGKQVRDLMQTTVVADSATDADILSTTLFVLGPEQGMSFVNDLPGIGAIFVDSTKQLSYTNNLINQLEFN